MHGGHLAVQTCSFSWVALACALQLSAGAAIRRALCGREAQLLRAWARPLCSPPELAPAAPVLLCGRLPGCCSAPQQTQCTPTYTHKNRERDQTNPKRASELNQNRPLRGQEEGRASFPMDSKFNSPSKNSNPRRGRKGKQKNKTKQKGATGTCEAGSLLPSSLFFIPSNSLD